MHSHDQSQGLTTTKAPFIENARQHGEIFIRQPYELYNDDNQAAWTKLYERVGPLWHKYANEKFLIGLEALALNAEKIPKLDEINRYLEPLTGFQARAVCGYVPTFVFFDSLRKREFPTTITIRDSAKLDYLPEPDIFHDIAGHVPMHTDPTFANVLVKFGALAQAAVERHAHVASREERLARVRSNIQALSRFFWFTIEFGIMRQQARLCVYGSGIMSSAGEIVYSIESPEVRRAPFQLEWVINQTFEIDRFQPLLFVIDSFEHLYDEVGRLEEWLHAGKLDNVSGGGSVVDDESLQSFLQ